MPGADGVNRVVARDIERDNAEEAAVKAAKEYCEEQKQHAAFIEDKTQYTGTMDEGTRNTVRKASKAAMILGPATGIATSSGAAGGLLGGAGIVGHTMTNDRDYQAEVKFKCQ
jgi:hypothetical protein